MTETQVFVIRTVLVRARHDTHRTGVPESCRSTEMEPTPTKLCPRCGKKLAGDSPRDVSGDACCPQCIQRLHGKGAHTSAAAKVCGLCGDSFEVSEDPSRKGNCCPDCVARLRGERPRRRETAAVAGRSSDSAFDQMLSEVFGAAGSGAEGVVALA